MRGRFIRTLLDRMLPESCPDEAFFSAGPPRRPRQVAVRANGRPPRQAYERPRIAAPRHRQASGS